MKMNLQEFGRRVKKRRKDMNMNQSDLAEAIGISVPHMSAIENGKHAPNYFHICNLCNALHVTPDFLLLGDSHSPRSNREVIEILSSCSESDLKLIERLTCYLIEEQEEK